MKKQHEKYRIIVTVLIGSFAFLFIWIVMLHINKTKKATLDIVVAGSPPIPSNYYNPKISVYEIVQENPLFPGGKEALFDFINKNIKYPVDAKTSKLEGKVIVRFIVTKEGKAMKGEILKGASPSLNKEALRIIDLLPTWIPGKQAGVKVSVYQTVPIYFKLQQ